MTKKQTDLISLLALPDNRIKAADDFQIAATLRDTLQLIEHMVRTRKLPSPTEHQHIGFYTGKLYDQFLAEHTQTMQRHIRRQTEKPVGEHVLIPLQWSFGVPENVQKLFKDAGVYLRWFTIETRLTIRLVGKVKPMLTYSGRSTLVNFEPFILMRLVEYITKLNVDGGLPERVNKLEQIVEGLSKSAIVAAAAKEQNKEVVDEWFAGEEQEFENRLKTGKTVVNEAPAWQESLLKFLDLHSVKPWAIEPRSWEEAFWRDRFALLKQCPPEIQLECIRKWVTDNPPLRNNKFFADWAIENSSWILFDGKDKPRKR